MYYRTKVLQAVLISLGVGFLLSCIIESCCFIVLLGLICIVLGLLLPKCH